MGRPSRIHAYDTVTAAGDQPLDSAVKVDPTAGVPEIEAAPPLIAPSATVAEAELVAEPKPCLVAVTVTVSCLPPSDALGVYVASVDASVPATCHEYV
jgi:hypothetical protein